MDAYQDMVFSTAVRLTANPAQAEDIAQEVFLRAYERFSSLRRSATAGGWLKTVATHLALNHLSRYRRRWRFFSEVAADGGTEEPLEIADEQQDLPMQLQAEERRELIEQALARLPEHQRVPLVLFHFEEMPYQEIARRLKISLAKAKTDILRGRQALARQLAGAT